MDKKIKISSNLILVEIMCVIAIIFFSKLIIENNNDVDFDFKTLLEYKISLFIFIAGLIYFITRPSIYYDSNNIYIKKTNKNVIIIPLKKIRSIFKSPFGSKGTTMFTIEYINDENEKDSIRFNGPYFSNKLSNFMAILKETNPHIEIV